MLAKFSGLSNQDTIADLFVASCAEQDLVKKNKNITDALEAIQTYVSQFMDEQIKIITDLSTNYNALRESRKTALNILATTTIAADYAGTSADRKAKRDALTTFIGTIKNEKVKAGYTTMFEKEAEFDGIIDALETKIKTLAAPAGSAGSAGPPGGITLTPDEIVVKKADLDELQQKVVEATAIMNEEPDEDKVNEQLKIRLEAALANLKDAELSTSATRADLLEKVREAIGIMNQFPDDEELNQVMADHLKAALEKIDEYEESRPVLLSETETLVQERNAVQARLAEALARISELEAKGNGENSNDGSESKSVGEGIDELAKQEAAKELEKEKERVSELEAKILEMQERLNKALQLIPENYNQAVLEGKKQLYKEISEDTKILLEFLFDNFEFGNKTEKQSGGMNAKFELTNPKFHEKWTKKYANQYDKNLEEKEKRRNKTQNLDYRLNISEKELKKKKENELKELKAEIKSDLERQELELENDTYDGTQLFRDTKVSEALMIITKSLLSLIYHVSSYKGWFEIITGSPTPEERFAEAEYQKTLISPKIGEENAKSLGERGKSKGLDQYRTIAAEKALERAAERARLAAEKAAEKARLAALTPEERAAEEKARLDALSPEQREAEEKARLDALTPEQRKAEEQARLNAIPNDKQFNTEVNETTLGMLKESDKKLDKILADRAAEQARLAALPNNNDEDKPSPEALQAIAESRARVEQLKAAAEKAKAKAEAAKVAAAEKAAAAAEAAAKRKANAEANAQEDAELERLAAEAKAARATPEEETPEEKEAKARKAANIAQRNQDFNAEIEAEIAKERAARKAQVESDTAEEIAENAERAAKKAERDAAIEAARAAAKEEEKARKARLNALNAEEAAQADANQRELAKLAANYKDQVAADKAAIQKQLEKDRAKSLEQEAERGKAAIEASRKGLADKVESEKPIPSAADKQKIAEQEEKDRIARQKPLEGQQQRFEEKMRRDEERKTRFLASQTRLTNALERLKKLTNNPELQIIIDQTTDDLKQINEIINPTGPGKPPFMGDPADFERYAARAENAANEAEQKEASLTAAEAAAAAAEAAKEEAEKKRLADLGISEEEKLKLQNEKAIFENQEILKKFAAAHKPLARTPKVPRDVKEIVETYTGLQGLSIPKISDVNGIITEGGKVKKGFAEGDAKKIVALLKFLRGIKHLFKTGNREDLNKAKEDYKEIYEKILSAKGGAYTPTPIRGPEELPDILEEQEAWNKANDAYNNLDPTYKTLLPPPEPAPISSLATPFQNYINNEADPEALEEARDSLGMVSPEEIEDYINNDEYENEMNGNAVSQRVAPMYQTALPRVKPEWVSIMIRADILQQLLQNKMPTVDGIRQI